jgi:hypothetical protein
MNKYCQHCSHEQHASNTLCPQCGKTPFVTFEEKDNSGLDPIVKVISFCVPLIGGILFFVHKGSSPNKSKDACTAACWGMLIGFILQIFAVIANG